MRERMTLFQSYTKKINKKGADLLCKQIYHFLIAFHNSISFLRNYDTLFTFNSQIDNQIREPISLFGI